MRSSKVKPIPIRPENKPMACSSGAKSRLKAVLFLGGRLKLPVAQVGVYILHFAIN